MIVLFYFIMFLLLISFSVVLYNYLTAPRLSSSRRHANSPGEDQLISVLIPARNEKDNIAVCLQSVLKQTYKNFEIIVLDDNSEDETALLAESFAGADNRFRLVSGLPLMSPWLGKNWACHQLSTMANGSIFLFIDADVTMSPQALSLAVNRMIKYNLGMLSVFPTQKLKTIGEYLIVPMMNWLLLSFLPLRLVYSSSNKSFAAANGQFIMITREAYFSVKGHEALCSEIVEDMVIARNIKKAGLRVMTLLGSDTVMCRMYRSYKEAYTGFSKNFFAGFNIQAVAFRRLLELMEAVFLLPFILASFYSPFVICIAVILVSRILISVMSGQNILFNVLLHPLQMISLFITGINSISVKRTNKVIWKDRTY